MKISRNMLFFISLALVFCLPLGRVFADSNADDLLIEQINALELKKFQFRTESLQGLEQILKDMDKEKTPRAWIHGMILSLKELDATLIGQMDGLIQQAVDKKDLGLLYRLIIWKVSQEKDLGHSEADIRKLFARMEPLCPESSPSVWCGRLYDSWADFDYNSIDKAHALIQSKKATAILERVKGADVFYLYDAQTTLAKILSNTGQASQAIKLSRDNYAWYDQNEFHSRATSEATNMTIYMTSGLQPYKRDHLTKEKLEFEREVLQWLDKAEIHDAETGDNHQKSIAYSRARFLYKIGRFEEAIRFAEKSRELNLKAEWLDFAALSDVTKAMALIQLNRLKEAGAVLDGAEKLVPKSYIFEHTSILEARIFLADVERNFEQAFKLLKVYHNNWKDQKAEEEKQGMNRLNAEMGLKLEEERNERLSKENELQKQKIREAEVIRLFVFFLGILSLSTIGFLLFALRQTRQVKISQRKMQRILDNIDEGLLTFDRTRKISDDYSKRLPEILGSSHSLVGQDIMGVIFGASQLSGEEQSIIHEVLEATFQEERLAWDLNAENLCQELRFDKDKDQVVELRWIPLFDGQNKLGRILLSLTDVTAKKGLEKAFGQQKRYLQALPDTLKEMLVGQPQHIARLLEATQEVLEKLQTEVVDAPLLRGLHTQKGIARALGLKALSHDLHDLETILQPKTGHSMGQGLHEQLNGVRDRLIEYRAIAEVLNSTQRLNTTIRNSLAHTLQAHIPSWLDQMQKGGQELHKLSIMDGVLIWQSEQLHILEQVCVHAVNNSLDHGFLEADSPIKHAEIEISVEKLSGSIHLEVRDNGQGLNMEQLSQLAKARGFVPKGTETIADVVFCDGFSLAKRLSLSSGRGVGLSAVKELIEKNGGEVRLQNRSPIRGSVLRAIWPVSG